MDRFSNILEDAGTLERLLKTVYFILKEGLGVECDLGLSVTKLGNLKPQGP